MNKKIPCGGFYLSDTLGVDENGKLGVNGGEPYKSLVTDGEGNVKWEDRLAYGDNRICVSTPEYASVSWYKVSDDLPTGSYDIGTRVYIIDSDGDYYRNEIMVSNGEVIATNGIEPKVIVALHDNVTFLSTDGWSITLPEKGTYFADFKDYYITGVVLGDSNEPEITWDGSVFVGKKIEQMYIPKQTVYVELEEAGYENDVEQYEIRMTLDEVIGCIRDNINVVLVCRFYNPPRFYCLSECSDERASFVYIGPDGFMEEFTITANSSKAAINDIIAYVRKNGYNSIDTNKFLVVESSGYVHPSSNLILPSSTSGSKKKFKITVDDTGTISATEVTS